jgi:hypothetical protein
VVSGEVHFQTDNDVLSPELLPCGERLYYNGQIGSVKFITPEFMSAETRIKIAFLFLKEISAVFTGENFVPAQINSGWRVLKAQV